MSILGRIKDMFIPKTILSEKYRRALQSRRKLSRNGLTLTR